MANADFLNNVIYSKFRNWNRSKVTISILLREAMLK